MKTQSDLRAHLRAIDHRSYPAYKELRGSYDFGGFLLQIDHVQGDPFAAPSAVSVTVPAAQAAFPSAFLSPGHRRTALEDHLVRLFSREAEKYSGKARGSGKSGRMEVSRPGQEVLARSACTVSERGDVVFRMEIGFPANGRTINARELEKILFEFLPACVRAALYYRSVDRKQLKAGIDLSDDQLFIRQELGKRGLCAFVADGAVLPRESGVSDLPMRGAVPFYSPESLRVEMDLPHAGRVTGMGIKRGITLIAGGGYHGKSTLLHALERGVYDHIAGDGREYVIADNTAVKIRAEDGRSIVCDDISLFISNLPGGKDTVRFSTENASGSTSQAAAVVEAAEAGCRVLLIDEDTSATNFMVRDELMQRVIAPDKEPITPFISRARLLFEKNGISTILALGSSGAWFTPADCILQMDEYRPVDITEKAKEAAKAFSPSKEAAGEVSAGTSSAGGIFAGGSSAGEKSAGTPSAGEGPAGSAGNRTAAAAFLDPGPGLPAPRRILLPDRAFSGDRIKTKTMGRDGFVIDRRTVDLRHVEQLADSEQSAALAQCLLYAERRLMDGKRTLPEIADALLALIEARGPGAVAEGSYVRTGLAAPRKAEICAMLSRFRGLRVR
ncbi:MAG: ABC-ATPase domain-containing protein [Eubacteriales bacterium]|nr:ABC-ATPase domain-containing protein [Eubacteriales bacterium]